MSQNWVQQYEDVILHAGNPFGIHFDKFPFIMVLPYLIQNMINEHITTMEIF